MKKLLIFCALIASFTCARAQTSLYVDSSMAASGTGTSWSSAYRTLNEALNVANAGPSATKYIINIAKGTYYPTGLSSGTNRDSTFLIQRSGIALYGGYSSGGSRNPAANPTTLSGRMNSVKSYHVVVIAGTTTSTDSAILDGLNITGGQANGSSTVTYNTQQVSRSHGGGIYIKSFTGKIRLTNCTLSSDSASGNGGGIYNTGGSCTISSCTFSGNTASGQSTSSGGGLFDTAAISTISNCTFSGNYATRGGGGMYTTISDTVRNCTFTGNLSSGGGALNYANLIQHGSVTATISNSTFSGNGVSGSVSSGGAIIGSGAFGQVPVMIIHGCTFSGNYAAYGGALFLADTYSVSRCRFLGNRTSSGDGGAINIYGGLNVLPPQQPVFGKIVSCVFSGNRAAGNGGAIYNDQASPSITNCTFSGDSAVNGYGLANVGFSTTKSAPVITNCIVWDGNNSVFNNSFGAPVITYSIVKQASGVYSGTGNLNVDPLFIAPLASGLAPTTGGNYRLMPCSPAINAGLNSASYIGVLDVADSPRLYNKTVDMGAYEYQAVVSCLDSVWAGDANADKIVDNADALEIALTMGSSGPARLSPSIAWQPAQSVDWPTMLLGYPAKNRKHADCNGDGIVTYNDTLAVTLNYGLTHPKSSHTNAKKTAGLPDLYFDVSGIVPIAGNMITVPVRLGTAAAPISNLAGIAARLMIDNVMPADTPALDYTGSWLGVSSNTLRFSKPISRSRVDWAYARTDQCNNNGSGVLTTLTFTIPPGTEGQQMRLYFDAVLLVDSNGQKITQYNVVDDTLTILAVTGVATNAAARAKMVVSPNPSSGVCNVQLNLPVAASYTIQLHDPSGKLLLYMPGQGKAGLQNISLPTDALSSGVYLINAVSEGQVFLPVRWIKE